MPKYQYLISKHHWKSKENVINLSADSAFLFSGMGSKAKTQNWWKVFKTFLIPIYTSLTSSKGFKVDLNTFGLF